MYLQKQNQNIQNESLTWLDKPHIKDFVHLTVISSDVEDTLRWVLDAGDVDWHQILWHLLPLDRPGTTGTHMKHLRPQPANTELELHDSKSKAQNGFTQGNVVFKDPIKQSIWTNSLMWFFNHKIGTTRINTW